MSGCILSLDQGTSSSRAILFTRDGGVEAVSQNELISEYPREGWVEQDAEGIWHSQERALLEVLEQSKVDLSDVAAIGITNQRETTIVWDRQTGEAIYPAIVWQDKRTAGICEQLKHAGLEPVIRGITGLAVDPYFSATKVRWILDHVEGARERAEAGALCFGTVDSWLVWKLSGGSTHVTDATNASRTMLYNLVTGDWDDDLLEKFQIPRNMLPRVVDSSAVVTEWRGIPVASMVGDQQAALFGQGCVAPGDSKNTYGTGCFMLMNTGDRVIRSEHQLLSTVALQVGGQRTYALEGAVFMAGALFKWMRDQMGIVDSVRELDTCAMQVASSGGVVVVPAHAGLGAPYWNAEARGLIAGLSQHSNKQHICRAAIESVGMQVSELIDCFQHDACAELEMLRVDGGACVSDVFMQLQACVLESMLTFARKADWQDHPWARSVINYEIAYQHDLPFCLPRFFRIVARSIYQVNSSYTSLIDRVRILPIDSKNH
ncbi:FGGY family carbohydrate kinase [Rubritalea marina]|uniref:FGGY family carbohydrate kinase n=1 Tax=Rubritalea marina TaxID=361055 RepID=UPI000360A87F|nr:glycerol kinase GlpK [Rubritalea marina]